MHCQIMAKERLVGDGYRLKIRVFHTYYFMVMIWSRLQMALKKQASKEE